MKDIKRTFVVLYWFLFDHKRYRFFDHYLAVNNIDADKAYDIAKSLEL